MASSTTTSAPSGTTRLRRGSNFSDGQICHAVKDGKAVRVMLDPADEDELVGWIYGMDDYHWGLVEADGSTHLIHKTVPRLSILDWHTIDSLPKGTQESIEPVVRSFRQYVMRTHFSHLSQTADN